MFAGFYRSGCLLHSLAEMEAARLGTPYQGIIYHAALKIIKTFYKLNQTSGEPHLPRHLHPGHHLHYCGPHDNHTRRDRCGLPTRALDYKINSISAIGLAIIATAVPVYFLFISWRNKPAALQTLSGSVTSLLQRLLVVVPPSKRD